MSLDELVYRPPYEAASFLLQVTHGCSHNRCTFCTMYRGVPFSAETDECIERQLAWAKARCPEKDRVFLENGDPFALPAERLLEIADMIHAYLPRVETIAMYASVKNLKGKTDDDLRRLRACGINDLNIGVESGLDAALAAMNKGYTAAEALHHLERLGEAGISYGANIIFGCAGPDKWRENAAATALLLNRTRPYLIFTGTLHADPGCPLYDDLQSGAFVESSFGEYLDEEETLLRALTLDDCYFFGLHPSNVVQMRGWLSRDKADLIAEVQETRRRLHDQLDQRPVRAGEGGIIRING